MAPTTEVPASYDVIERINMIREQIEDTKQLAIKLTDGGSRELSTALTRLDEARLWLMEAIAAPVTAIHVRK